MSVPALSTFQRHWAFFRALTGKRLYVLILISSIASYAEGLGIALFLPIFATIGGANHVGGSGLLGGLVNRMLGMLGLEPTLGGALMLLAGLMVLKGVAMFASNAYQYRLANDVARGLRLKLVSALGGVEFRHVLGVNTGVLTNTITTEVDRSSTAFVYFSRVFPHLLSVFVFVSILLAADWKLTALIGIAATCGALLLWIPIRLAHRYSMEVTRENGRLQSLLIQMVQSLKYLLSTARFGQIEKQVERSVSWLADTGYRVGALAGASQAFGQPLIVLFLAGVLFYQRRVAGGDMAAVFVLMAYVFRAMSEAVALQAEWQNFCTFIGGLDAVSQSIEKLEVNREAVATEGGFAGLTEAVEFHDLTFSYDQRNVLEGLSLRVARNSTVAFVGDSGAGKSTLVDLMTGVLKPTRGSVLIDGVDLRALDVTSYRRRIGYVPQEAMLFDDTIVNNITTWTQNEADLTYLDAVRDAARRAHCADFIENMPQKYQSRVGDRGTSVSGGQRQRLAIARELFKKPELLILDEATSALDGESERMIRESIESLKGQMTIVIIAHRLPALRGVDQIFVLEQGRIAEHGTFEQLFHKADSRFRRMYDVQNLQKATP